MTSKLLVSLLALIALGFVVGSGTVATAEAAQMVGPSHHAAVTPAGSGDACGTVSIDVPDSGDFFDFTSACQSHDSCYAAGGTDQDRYACDRHFGSAMLQDCSTRSGLAAFECRLLANLYYIGVRIGGRFFFNYT